MSKLSFLGVKRRRGGAYVRRACKGLVFQDTGDIFNLVFGFYIIFRWPRILRLIYRREYFVFSSNRLNKIYFCLMTVNFCGILGIANFQ